MTLLKDDIIRSETIIDTVTNVSIRWENPFIYFGNGKIILSQNAKNRKRPSTETWLHMRSSLLMVNQM